MSCHARAALYGTLLVTLACTACSRGPAVALAPKTATTETLRREIVRADSLMFAAYNAHDAERLGAYFSKDLEFYHDTGGLLTWAQAMEGLTSNFAKGDGITRSLVGPVEVYAVRGYGAMEIGTHRFCHREAGRDVCGTFKFLMIWKQSADGWQVTRAASYDH